MKRPPVTTWRTSGLAPEQVGELVRIAGTRVDHFADRLRLVSYDLRTVVRSAYMQGVYDTAVALGQEGAGRDGDRGPRAEEEGA